jgi:hypothetical protein
MSGSSTNIINPTSPSSPLPQSSSRSTPAPTSLPETRALGTTEFRTTWKKRPIGTGISPAVGSNSTPRLPFELDNWSSLQDVFTDEDEDVATGTRRFASFRERSLKGLFGTPRLGIDDFRTEGRPMFVGNGRAGRDLQGEMLGLLSSSPPVMEHGIDTDIVPGEVGLARGRAVEDMAHPRTPLIGVRRPSSQPRSRSTARVQLSTYTDRVNILSQIRDHSL